MALRFWSLAVTTASFLFTDPTLARPQGDVNADAFYFFGWEGCNADPHPTWSSDILQAWDEVLEIGKSVTSDVDWTSDIAGDYLGSPGSNKEYQAEIQKILKNIQTWNHDGSFLAWKINARCDDYLRRSELNCPEGTKPEDADKCNSRCWQPIYSRDSGRNIVTGWKGNAAAYTTSHDGSTSVATINFCPSFFAMETCASKIARWGNSPLETSRLDMVNYQCRGYAALHELFHINSMAHRAAYRVKHVFDRKIQIWQPIQKRLVSVMAYGPLYTKTLANWSTNTGWWVATNADSLAQYALAMYVTGQIGAYPHYPIVSEAPRTDPGDVNFASIATLDTNDGKISLTDNPALLGAALGVDPTLAFDAFVAIALACSDAEDTRNATDPNAGPGIDLCGDTEQNLPAALFPVSHAPTGSAKATWTPPAPTGA
ncbi:hypothetical protein BDV95DRAFT_607416 [Massariosphaeria phaeospora]|uniref:Uncharacterized protein n=1 Tax=Massariosphaeria phaeospora TaxID=100035 RepID=A0A7C8M7J3_9PLEO|nr:hypothetical protein BDV95DRAFT_607416 [Massariosphaeria phaeospora]